MEPTVPRTKRTIAFGSGQKASRQKTFNTGFVGAAAHDHGITDGVFAVPRQILRQGIDLIVMLAEWKAHKLALKLDRPRLILFDQHPVLGEHV